MVFCVNCGTELAEGWNVCPQCGVKRVSLPSSSNFSEDGQWHWNGDEFEWVPNPTKPSITNPTKPSIIYTKKIKSKGIAYALNFLIPGLGNLYLGNSWAVGFMLIWFVVAGIGFEVGLGAWFLFAIIFVFVSCAIVSNDYRRYMRNI